MKKTLLAAALVAAPFAAQAEHGPQRLDVFRLETGLVDALKRAYTLAKRIARIEAPKPVIEGKAA